VPDPLDGVSGLLLIKDIAITSSILLSRVPVCVQVDEKLGRRGFTAGQDVGIV